MMRTQKSYIHKSKNEQKKWYLVDADSKIVGRLASDLATLLRGKNNPWFTPHIDSGDFVVVINANKIRFTGKKWDEKIYYRHSGHIGGLKKRTAREQFERSPREILFKAVKGMLPKNSLGRKQLTKLKVFDSSEHSHQAQKPTPLHFKGEES